MPWHPKMNLILKLSTCLSSAASVSSVCLFGVLHDISSWGFGVPYQRMKWNSRFLLERVNSLRSIIISINYQRDCPFSLCGAAVVGTARDDPSSSLSTARKSSGCLSSPPRSFITFPVSFKVLSLLSAPQRDKAVCWIHWASDQELHTESSSWVS